MTRTTSANNPAHRITASSQNGRRRGPAAGPESPGSAAGPPPGQAPLSEIPPLRLDGRDLMTEEQTAQALCISPSTLRTWRSHGRYPELRFVRLGSRVRYLRHAVEAFLRERIAAEATVSAAPPVGSEREQPAL